MDWWQEHCGKGRLMSPSLPYLLLGELSWPSPPQREKGPGRLSKWEERPCHPWRPTQWGSLPNRKAVWMLAGPPRYLALRATKGAIGALGRRLQQEHQDCRGF